MALKLLAGWLAIEQGLGSADGLQFQAGIADNDINHRWNTIKFDDNFETTPNFLASLGSYNGSNSAGLRYGNIDSEGVKALPSESKKTVV